MAVYKIFPSKDSTLYSLYPSMNTGTDEIIEATSTTVNDIGNFPYPETSRMLLQFSNDELTSIIDNKISNSTWQATLRLFNAKFTGLNLDSSLKIYPISGSWDMGTGHYLDNPKVNNGCSWIWRDYSGSIKWDTSGYGTNATASWSGSNTGGGNWYTGSSTSSFNITQSQNFDYSSILDLKVDVTDTIQLWYSGSLVNDGFMIKQPSDKEFTYNPNTEVEMKFFSIDTHTIYPPQLEFKWYDYSFNTGSSTNTIINTPELVISSPNNAGVFHTGSIQRFRLDVRPKYPKRVFQTASLYTTNYYLPESQSLYAIKDEYTNEYVIDFDSTYTRIGADSSGSYFDIYMDGLEPERYYTVLVKTVLNNTTLVIDEDINFKISN